MLFVEQLKSPIGLGKVAIAIVSVVTLGVGLDSHYASHWTHEVYEYPNSHIPYSLYDICKDPRRSGCPSISMERFFVAMIIICFILSFLSLIASLCYYDPSSKFNVLIDFGYHVSAAIVLTIAGILYIVSTEKINKLGVVYRDGSTPSFRRGEKLFSGVLAVFQGFMCGGMGFLIIRRMKSSSV